MKKTLSITFLLFSFWIRSQVVFCPKGAEWNYNFNLAFSAVVSNEKIQYVRDSIMGPDTVKVLSLGRFYKMCNLLTTELVLIKQTGDVVSFRCKATQHNWEILYNYGAAAGDIWQTKILLGNNTLNTYTVQVNTVTTTVENGVQLKQLEVDYIWMDLPADPTLTYNQTYTITERFGCNAFLFNYRNGLEGACDGDYFERFLCYRDSTFGLKQFTIYPCDFEITVGMKEFYAKEQVKIYPNPSKNKINVSVNEDHQKKITLTNILGREILIKESSEKNIMIDTEQLQSGIYFLKICGDKRQSVHKIIIEK